MDFTRKSDRQFEKGKEPDTPFRLPGLFTGPLTRERVILYLCVILGNFLSAPISLVAAVLWWSPTKGEGPSSLRYRRKWLLAALLLGTMDLLLLCALAYQMEKEGDLAGLQLSAPGGEPVILGVITTEEDQHLIVKKILPETAAANAGLLPGDEIISLDGITVTSHASLRVVLSRYTPGEEVEISYFRDGQVRRVMASLEGEPEHLTALRRGYRALRLDNLEKAREELELSLELYSPPGESVSALSGLASVLDRLGEHPSAMSVLDRAVLLAEPEERDALRARKVVVALNAGDARGAESGLAEIAESSRFHRELLPRVHGASGRQIEGWLVWLLSLTSRPAAYLFPLSLIILALFCRFRRTEADGLRLLIASGGTLVSFLLIGLAASGAYGIVAHGNSLADPGPVGVTVIAVVTLIAFLAVTLLAHRWVTAEPRPTLGFQRGGKRLLGISVAGAFLMLGMALRVETLIHVIAPSAEGLDIHPMSELASRDLRYALYLYPVVCLLGPLVEEVFFRGFLHAHLRTRIGPAWTILGTALIFGLEHSFSLKYVAATTGLGLVLGFIRERSQSLVPPILAHAAFNTLVWSVVFLGLVLPD